MITRLNNHIVELIKNIIFPPACCICSKEGSFLCESCEGGLIFCDQVSPKFNAPHIDNIIASFSFDSQAIKKLLYNFKYEFVRELGPQLAKLMARVVPKDAAFLVCPVPLFRKRFKWRGFNQSEDLAKSIAEIRGLKFINALERIKFNKPQMELDREERFENAKNSFRINPLHIDEIKNAAILLVDDVATTVSTLNACAKVLKENGCASVTGLVLARAYGES